MKKLVLLFFLILVIFSLSANPKCLVFAENSLEQQLTENVSGQLNDLDFSALDEIVSKFNDSQFSIFGSGSFFERLQKIISGEFAEGYDNVFAAILNLMFEGVLNFLPLIFLIVAISVVGSFVSSFKSGKNVNDIVHFVTFAVIVVLVCGALMQLLDLAQQTMLLLKTQMEVIFPILLTLMVAMGGAVGVKVYQPAVAVLSGGVMEIFDKIIFPLFIISVIFIIVGNLTNGIKLNKFNAFFTSLYKWILGVTFTIFMAFLSLQGITASTFDGISIRTAKFAVKSYIPILGGYLSDGFDIILNSSLLVKNAVGVTGLLVMAATIIVPIIKIAIFGLALKLTAAIIEPIGDGRTSNFLQSISKLLSMLTVCILGIAFMYSITVALIIFTSNAI